MTRFDPRMMVKQYVAEIITGRGQRFRVFETGDAKWWLMDPLDDHGCSRCCGFPMLKSRFKPELRRALAHGVGFDLTGNSAGFMFGAGI